jgi:hypothetical protein
MDQAPLKESEQIQNRYSNECAQIGHRLRILYSLGMEVLENVKKAVELHKESIAVAKAEQNASEIAKLAQHKENDRAKRVSDQMLAEIKPSESVSVSGVSA